MTESGGCELPEWSKEKIVWHKGHRLRAYWDRHSGAWRVQITCDAVSTLRPSADEAVALGKMLVDWDLL